MKARVRYLPRDVTTGTEGATAVEYSVLVALIAAVIVTSVAFVGLGTRGGFDCVNEQVSTSTSTTC